MMPQNAGYYYAAYIVVIAVYALYALSIWWRGRHVDSDSPGFRP